MRYLVLAFLVLTTSFETAAQEELTRADAAAILFSNRFSFTDDGEPVLPVRIMDEQKTIEFSSPDGLIVYPSGPDGPSVRVDGKQKWTVTAKGASPAKLGYRAVLQSAATKDFEPLRQAAASWKKAGVETMRLELGTLFSFEGTVFDSRTTLLCAKQLFQTAKEARQYLAKLPKSDKGDFYVRQVLAKRPTGEVLMKGAAGGASITAKNAIWFEPIGGRLTVLDVEYAKGFNWHGRKTRRYGGSFYVAIDKYGKLAIANVLPAERLLMGLVPAEIFPDSHLEALKAQAMAARNELYSKIGHRHLADPYLICSDQHCQVYKGLNAERDNASRAVRRTRGKVVFDANGKLADIRYHSTCGGHTEDAHEAWPGVDAEHLAGRWDSAKVKDPYAPVDKDKVRYFLENPPKSFCKRSPKAKSTFRWTKKVPAGKLDKKVGEKHKVGRVEAIDVLHRGVSGRVNKIRIVGDQGQAEVNGELVIRRLFHGLRSSLFVVDAVKTASGRIAEWVFKGGGFGHGVGMCQVGATEMAKDGISAIDILKYYYRNISVKRIY